MTLFRYNIRRKEIPFLSVNMFLFTFGMLWRLWFLSLNADFYFPSVSTALASHDYILKIVPTVYEDMSGKQRYSYQYTVANKVKKQLSEKLLIAAQWMHGGSSFTILPSSYTSALQPCTFVCRWAVASAGRRRNWSSWEQGLLLLLVLVLTEIRIVRTSQSRYWSSFRVQCCYSWICHV